MFRRAVSQFPPRTPGFATDDVVCRRAHVTEGLGEKLETTYTRT